MALNKGWRRCLLFPFPRLPWRSPRADVPSRPFSLFPSAPSIPGAPGSRIFSALLLLILAPCLLEGLPLAVSAETAPPESSGFRRVRLEGPPARINDGDTFEADLDGDGRLSFPRERVRLLFLDTPELSESWKGVDREHGLAAKEFLRQALARPPIFLLVPKRRATGKYGRTLAVVYAGGRNVNLGLIRAGHAPFDTRFGFPADYRRYARAEGEAFDARRGIWRLPASRRRYLKRLRRDLKTPAGRRNPAYLPKVYRASRFRPRGLLGRYLRLEGRVKNARPIFKRGRLNLLLLQLERGGRSRSFTAVLYRSTIEKLRAESWAAGARLRLEGFIETYRGRPQLVVHYGRKIE